MSTLSLSRSESAPNPWVEKNAKASAEVLACLEAKGWSSAARPALAQKSFDTALGPRTVVATLGGGSLHCRNLSAVIEGDADTDTFPTYLVPHCAAQQMTNEFVSAFVKSVESVMASSRFHGVWMGGDRA